MSKELILSPNIFLSYETNVPTPFSEIVVIKNLKHLDVSRFQYCFLKKPIYNSRSVDKLQYLDTNVFRLRARAAVNIEPAMCNAHLPYP